MSLATGRWRYCQAYRVMTDARSVHCFKGTEDSPCEKGRMAAWGRRESGKEGSVGGKDEGKFLLRRSLTSLHRTWLLHHLRPLGFVILEGAARSNRK